MIEQFRWYYNDMVDIFKEGGFEDCKEEFKEEENEEGKEEENEEGKEEENEEGKEKSEEENKKKGFLWYSARAIRQKFRKYKYIQERHGNIIFTEGFDYSEEFNEFPVPMWWNPRGLSRIIRGAINKFTYNLNSSISNLMNGNIKKFQMNHLKKKLTSFLHFEDQGYPAFIKKIKSRYWFTAKNGKKKSIPYSEIFEENKKGLEIIHEKYSDKWFIHCPVKEGWYPLEDRRNESQATLSSSCGDTIISLDPGIRKFMTGYDPNGKSIIFAEGSCAELSKLLLKVDKLSNYRRRRNLWNKIKNLIKELHWKISNFLTTRYDHILLPDFRTSQMVVKGKPLGKMTRRLMNMFSFYKFKTKLTYKCNSREKKIYTVDESYTSKTCGRCGTLNDIKSSETYICYSCNYKIDRDILGSRNILLKNLVPRSGSEIS
jgi:IS605 OrfB family transposase